MTSNDHDLACVGAETHTCTLLDTYHLSPTGENVRENENHIKRTDVTEAVWGWLWKGLMKKGDLFPVKNELSCAS